MGPGRPVTQVVNGIFCSMRASASDMFTAIFITTEGMDSKAGNRFKRKMVKKLSGNIIKVNNGTYIMLKKNTYNRKFIEVIAHDGNSRNGGNEGNIKGT